MYRRSSHPAGSLRLASLAAALCWALSVACHAQDSSPASSPTEAGDAQKTFPIDIQTTDGTVILYQPQLDFWNGFQLEGRFATVLQPADSSKPPIYGVLGFEARTLVDKGRRLVVIDEVKLTSSSFPSAPDKAAAVSAAVAAKLGPMQKTVELDRLQEQLKIMNAKEVADAIPVKNDPPAFLFSTTPAMLVQIAGEPVLKQVANTPFSQVINTSVLLLKDAEGRFYLHVFDGWMYAKTLTGDWIAIETTDQLQAAQTSLTAAQPQLDLLTGAQPAQDDQPAPAPPSLKTTVPKIYVATTPTELLVTAGDPQWVPIDGTNLLYASNTTGTIIVDSATSSYYILSSGRWFKAAALSGPWAFVPGSALPADFAKIPDDSAKENVKASVPGTVQAKEAVIENSIPQTAAVKIAEVKVTNPTYDGKPQLVEIDGTELKYVKNASRPIIQTAPNSYYSVENGIWFEAGSLQGPWVVATSVPAAVYSIPASSPLHYVTYVRVYSSTPDVVYVGYTPGYYGTCIGADGVVVYGTGYVYEPWIGDVYYAPPYTYGYAASLTYTPWTGWYVGFGFGWAWGAATAGWGWGPYPYWGPWRWYPAHGYVGPHGGAAIWGPGGWAGTTGDIYHRWGNTSVVTRWSGGYNAWTGTGWAGERGVSYNSRTGRVSAGQRGVAANAYTGNYAAGSHGTTYNPNTGRTISAGRGTVGNVDSGKSASGGYVHGSNNTVANVNGNIYGDHDGNVYRKTDDGNWQTYSNGNWNDVDKKDLNKPVRSDNVEDRGYNRSNSDTFTDLNREWSNRESSYQRSENFRSAGGFGGFSDGGGMRGGFRRR